MPVEPSQYDKGRMAGETAATLAEHAAHLAKINGSMDKVAGRLEGILRQLTEMVLQVQRLGDAADADRATVKTTAAALKEADAARRDSTDQRWSPKARLIAAVVAVAAVIEAAILIYNSLK